MRRLARENSLGLVFLALFLVALVLLAVAGHAAYDDEQAAHGEPGSRSGATSRRRHSRRR